MLCIGYGRAAAARRMRGLSPHEGSVFAERTSHPPPLRSATFSQPNSGLPELGI